MPEVAVLSSTGGGGPPRGPPGAAHATRRAHLRHVRRRRAVYGLIGVLAVLAAGTLGLHFIEGASYVDSFYFESMLATGQGPPFPLATTTGKLFASAMAFISVGSVITTLIFTLGPVMGRLWREGLEWIELEARRVESELDPPRGPPPEPR